jgi:hypothetical protein
LVSVLREPAQAQDLTAGISTPNSGLLTLLKERNYFALKKQLALTKSELAPHEQLFFQAYLDNAFNQNKEAVQHISLLLSNYSSTLSDSAKAILSLLRGDSYFKLFDYSAAARNDSIALHQYARALDSNKVEEVKNKLIIYNGLKATPPQQTIITRTTSISWKRNKLGIVEIPLTRQRVSYDAVFDTRANISVVTQSYASKLRLRYLPVSYYEGSGITGIRFKTSLAIADSLSIGNILVRHAVFQVVPDSVLYIAPVDFQINIIVGFPIIEQLNEVHFYKEGRMEIPARTTKSELQNMALDGLNPVLALRTEDGDTVNFAFDFGASKTMLFAAYYQKYRQSVLAKAVKTTTEYGGAGGIQRKEVLTLPSVVLFLGSKKAVLDSVDVLSEKVFAEETFYGNIGQDFIGQFRKLVLNFRDMYIKGF